MVARAQAGSSWNWNPSPPFLPQSRVRWLHALRDTLESLACLAEKRNSLLRR